MPLLRHIPGPHISTRSFAPIEFTPEADVAQSLGDLLIAEDSSRWEWVAEEPAKPSAKRGRK